MRILNFYLINDNTLRMVPIIAENGSMYTVVIERDHMAVVGKCPSTLIEESKRFYSQPPKGHYIKRKWGSIGVMNKKHIQANFQLTKSF